MADQKMGPMEYSTLAYALQPFLSRVRDCKPSVTHPARDSAQILVNVTPTWKVEVRIEGVRHVAADECTLHPIVGARSV